MRHSIRIVFTLMAFVLVLGATQAGASVPPPPAEGPRILPPQARAVKVTPVELEDLRDIARSRGLSEAEAVRTIGWQDEFALGVTRLQEQYPEAYADAGISAEGVWVSFKASAPSDLATVLGPLPVEVEVRENLGWSEAELVELGEAAHYAALALADVDDVHTDIDTTSGVVDVAVQPRRSGPTSTAAAKLAEVTAHPSVDRARRAASRAIRVQLRSEDQLADGDDTVYGGGHLSTCTAAFSVRSSSYANGLLTAEHCGNSQSYEGRAVLTFRAAMAKAKGDVQWHSSSETASASFYHDVGARRALNATANSTAGMSVCKYGKNTGKTCDEVYKLNQCRSDYCNLVMTHRRKAGSGDSGGPWFYGNTGYGIHSGWKTYLLINRDMYTPVRSTATALGVTVKLS